MYGTRLDVLQLLPIFHSRARREDVGDRGGISQRLALRKTNLSKEASLIRWAFCPFL